MKSLNILNCSRLLQTSMWWSPYKNMKEKMILFYLSQQNISFELHMIYMLKPFPLQLSEADAAVWFNILSLIITNGHYCNDLTVGASLRVTLFFPAAYMPRPGNMRAAKKL